MTVLPYNPGALPTKKSPSVGEKIIIKLPGLPPKKDSKFSIRNRNHTRYEAFSALRQAAIKEMDGRAWSFGPIAIDLTIFSPKEIGRWELNDYAGGVMDTLDGSSGQTFTYLPVVFEDDCQVVKLETKWVQSKEYNYQLKISFIEG